MSKQRESFEYFSELTHEELFNEIDRIKNDLCWLDDDICLTKRQRELFVDIKFRVNKMLGNNR
jgi:hypothetical protein